MKQGGSGFGRSDAAPSSRNAAKRQATGGPRGSAFCCVKRRREGKEGARQSATKVAVGKHGEIATNELARERHSQTGQWEDAVGSAEAIATACLVSERFAPPAKDASEPLRADRWKMQSEFDAVPGQERAACPCRWSCDALPWPADIRSPWPPWHGPAATPPR